MPSSLQSKFACSTRSLMAVMLKKASLVHTVKHTFKLMCEQISEDVNVPQQPVQFLLQACHGRDVEGNRVNGAARRVVTLSTSRPRFSKYRDTW